MKKIIALRGVGNRGKSQTIKDACDLLAKYPGATIEHLAVTRGRDIKVLVTINGTKIGIESQGDPSNRLPASLKEFVGMGCEIIICATRSSGDTVEAVRKLGRDYEIVWLSHGENLVNSESKQKVRNQKTVKQIIAEVNKSLGSKKGQP